MKKMLIVLLAMVCFAVVTGSMASCGQTDEQSIKEQGERVSWYEKRLKDIVKQTVTMKKTAGAFKDDVYDAINLMKMSLRQDYENLDIARRMGLMKIFNAGESLQVLGFIRAKLDTLPILLVHIQSVRQPTDVFGGGVAYYMEAELFLDSI
jgi:hypothetical protein